MWGVSIMAPPQVALEGSPPGSWSIGFETDSFARATTAPVRPCMHPPVSGGRGHGSPDYYSIALTRLTAQT